MFHDKVGLFRDDERGLAIGFRGSANETFLGLSAVGNIESIDAWPSWVDGRDEQRVAQARQRFERLWSGQAPGVEVLALPAGLKAVLREAAGGRHWHELVDELAAVQERVAESRRAPDGRSLRPQQIEGLERWEAAGRRGILAHATGSGKTVTGITAIAEHAGPCLVVAHLAAQRRGVHDLLVLEDAQRVRPSPLALTGEVSGLPDTVSARGGAAIGCEGAHPGEPVTASAGEGHPPIVPCEPGPVRQAGRVAGVRSGRGRVRPSAHAGGGARRVELDVGFSHEVGVVQRQVAHAAVRPEAGHLGGRRAGRLLDGGALVEPRLGHGGSRRAAVAHCCSCVSLVPVNK